MKKVALDDQIAVAEKVSAKLSNPDDYDAMCGIVRTLKWFKTREDVIRALGNVPREDLDQCMSLLRQLGAGVEVTGIINYPDKDKGRKR